MADNDEKNDKNDASWVLDSLVGFLKVREISREEIRKEFY